MSRVGLQYSSAGGCAGVQVHSLKAGRTADTPLRLETGRQLARRIVHWHARDVREQPLLDVAHLSLQDLQRIRHEHLAARVKRVIHVVEHGLEVKQPLNDCRRIGARVHRYLPPTASRVALPLRFGLAAHQPQMLMHPLLLPLLDVE